MIRYLIKNNLKLMFRNKWAIAVMLVGPILVIMMLTSAFSNLLKTYEGVDSFKAGYRLEDGSMPAEAVSQMKETGKAYGITFYEYPDGNPEKLIQDNNLAAFVRLEKGKYTLYQMSDCEAEGMVLDYFLDKMSGISADGTAEKIMGEYEEVPVEKLDYMPAVNASDYYGIVHCVYFGWCGLVCATSVLSNEKKYGIERRFRVSALSSLQIYLARLIPMLLVVSVGMGISSMLCSVLFDIHWGVPLLSSFLMFLSFLGATSFGLMLYYLSKNLVISVIILFTTVWFMGFVGGSFETYMFSNIPEKIKVLSPIYHTDRALVELSVVGHSDYVGSTIIYLIAITVICMVVAVMVDKAGRGRRA